MLAVIGKYVGGRVLTAALVVTSAIAVIAYWNLPPEQKQAIWTGIRNGFIWVGFAAAMPWALFFVPPMIVRADSNLVSALTLGGYLVLDALVMFWLPVRHVSGILGWILVLLALACAAIYNFVVCEYSAQRAEQH